MNVEIQIVVLQNLLADTNTCYFNRINLKLRGIFRTSVITKASLLNLAIKGEMVNSLHKGDAIEAIGLVQRTNPCGRSNLVAERQSKALDNNIYFSVYGYHLLEYESWRPHGTFIPQGPTCDPGILDKIKKFDIWTYSQYIIDRFSGGSSISESGDQGGYKLNILAITYGRIPALQRFLKYASTYSPSMHFATLPSDVKFHQLFRSRGDCFPLSRNGILVFDYSVLKQQDYPFLTSIFSSDSTLDTGGSSANTLNTCFWSYADNIITCETANSQKNPKKCSDVTSLCLNHLFPIVLPVYMTSEQEALLADFLLSDVLYQTLANGPNDFKMLSECEHLLKKYFLAYRRFMIDNYIQDGSLNAMRTLVSLAIAYAKVFRTATLNSVIMFDVIICGKYSRSLLKVRLSSDNSYENIMEAYSYPYSDILAQVLNQLNDFS
ncbi:hypothetical protein K493DRAFT_297530 [Basidiobolus meristosporus CBS 931.73]|uniref:Uncharacterized protein n=1 Tax=Basidiobolus meristosporus CBS 931.73 TaxID=1314790 RepID=A0A1Y1Z0D9_9FUNG|nr:hypothetical protein K493DRAFT_297530 [Basidiobolus meristosporus CBS 931.73]|eukprot:ORY03275.1 hypothetical protein K493DRAFT_297530 [Basidiobolus meristosporus CBS 931.73]